jgi:hypothetical protein
VRVAWARRVKLSLSLERDLFTRLRKTLKSAIRCSLTTSVTRCWLRPPDRRAWTPYSDQ